MSCSRKKVKFEPPDGGWGWFVVLGCSLINLFTRSIEPSFGLLFGDKLKELGVATTGAAIIMSTLDAIINFSGFLVGPLIKKYSYRKVGFLGAGLACFAFLSTAPAQSMTHILITYSLCAGLGFGLATASTFVALNSYFLKRRGQAVGLAMAGTALGFMAMPQVISRLLLSYSFRDTMFIMGAASLNAMVGVSLLQPVQWHAKKVMVESETLLDKKKEGLEMVKPKERGEENTEVSSSLLALPRNNTVSGSLGLNRQNSKTEVSTSTLTGRLSTAMPRNSSNSSFAGPRRRKTSTISNVSCIDLMGSTLHVHVLPETDSECEDHDCEAHSKSSKKADVENGMLKSNNNISEKNNTKLGSKRSLKEKGVWKKIFDFMDFELLLDPKFLNILFGLSITYVAEMNFKLIVPFFMANMGYSKSEIARALSVMAIADITARIVMPPINDKLGYSRRKTLMLGLICVATARSILAEQTSWTRLMIALVVHGFFRGFTLINFPLVLSESVEQDKFAPAFGLSMVSKGIFIVALGPATGWIRDFTGSFPICLHAQSVMMMCCVVAWLVEFLFFSKKKPQSIDSIIKPS